MARVQHTHKHTHAHTCASPQHTHTHTHVPADALRPAQVSENHEIKTLQTILGLQHGAEYGPGGELLRDPKGAEPKTQSGRLRYGRLLLMCDQDEDGSHIKGLLISYLHYYWPSLLGASGPAGAGAGADGKESFVQQFVTPIVKAKSKKKPRRIKPSAGKAKGKQATAAAAAGGGGAKGQSDGEEWFYNLEDYHAWRHGLEAGVAAGGGEWSGSAGSVAKEWSIKYYKGLGTNTAAEAKQYFQQADKHTIAFEWDGPPPHLSGRPRQSHDGKVMTVFAIGQATLQPRPSTSASTRKRQTAGRHGWPPGRPQLSPVETGRSKW